MITDTEARKIASEWHGGQGTALYAFSSTGAINTAREDHQLLHEIEDCISSLSIERGAESPPELDDLFALRIYVGHTGNRGPVDGWGKLTW